MAIRLATNIPAKGNSSSTGEGLLMLTSGSIWDKINSFISKDSSQELRNIGEIVVHELVMKKNDPTET